VQFQKLHALNIDTTALRRDLFLKRLGSLQQFTIAEDFEGQGRGRTWRTGHEIVERRACFKHLDGLVEAVIDRGKTVGWRGHRKGLGKLLAADSNRFIRHGWWDRVTEHAVLAELSPTPGAAKKN
jgi:hypothetical protein